jgi:DNA polymerase kappa
MASQDGAADEKSDPPKSAEEFETLKYQLLGPSLTKAGQDTVDQQKVRFGNPKASNSRT